jgi:hypothetical protein
MPLGTECNRTDLNKTGINYKDGTPITEPHEFGTPVNLPHDFGNDIPVSDATLNSNPVTWPTPNPAHFGNINPNGGVPPPPVQAATPTFAPVAGSYGPTQSVSISSTTPGATIYYTTNGVDPTTGDTAYSGPVSVAVSETLKAIAVAVGFTNSAVGSAVYVINGQVATPTFSPVAGTYGGTQNVTISTVTSGATIYYTTNGSDPTTGSTQYATPVAVATSETLKALAVKANYVDSAIGSAAYTIVHTRSLTIDHTQVPNTDQSNFTVLVSLTDAALKSVANGGHVAGALGHDITFSSDSVGSSLYSWEIESYDPVNGVLVAWVKIPAVATAANTVFYIHYGDVSIVTFQGGAAGSAWDANYAGVYHLNADSMVNSVGSNDATNSGTTPATGKIAGGANFVSASSQYIVAPFHVSSETNFTFSGWLKVNANSVEQHIIESAPYQIFVASGVVRFYSGGAYTATSPAFSAGVWHYVTFVGNATGHFIYLDGALGSEPTNTDPCFATVGNTVFGALFNPVGGFLDGLMDEVRISNAVRSDDWIATEYNNQNNPSAFITLGAE